MGGNSRSSFAYLDRVSDNELHQIRFFNGSTAVYFTRDGKTVYAKGNAARVGAPVADVRTVVQQGGYAIERSARDQRKNHRIVPRRDVVSSVPDSADNPEIQCD